MGGFSLVINIFAMCFLGGCVASLIFGVDLFNKEVSVRGMGPCAELPWALCSMPSQGIRIGLAIEGGRRCQLPTRKFEMR